MNLEEWKVDAEACTDCERPTHHYGKPCFKHKMQYYQFSGAPGLPANSKPKHTKPPEHRRPDQNNSWEAGIKKDDRGIPILTSTGSPMRMAEYSANRHEVDSKIKDLRASSPPKT